MASIHKHPRSPYYNASFLNADGVWSRRSTKCTDRGDAMTVALEFERAAKKAGDGNLVEAQARRVLANIMERAGGSETLRAPTTRAFFTDWVKSIELNNPKPTYDRYNGTVKQFLASLGPRADHQLTSLTSADVEKFRDARVALGLAPKTISLDIKILRTALNQAHLTNLIPSNPTGAVKLPKKIKSVERGTYTPAEVKLLANAVANGDFNKEWKTIILAGYYLGARLGDCTRLEWERTDFKTLTYFCSKTQEDVTVPLHAALANHLRAIATSDKPQKFISPHMANLGSGGRHGLSESFKNIARKAGLDLQTVQGGGKRMISKRSFHALRHSFTSALANAGVASELRMKLTGHKTESVHRGYTHLELETLTRAVGKIPDINS